MRYFNFFWYKFKIQRYGCLKFLNKESLNLAFEELKNKTILNIPIRVDLSNDNVVAFKNENLSDNPQANKRLKLTYD